MSEKVCLNKCQIDEWGRACLGCGRTPAEICEAGERAMVVAEAQSWIMTPYVPCADIKGRGVDCAMILIRVYVDSGLCAAFDPRPYQPDWHLHRSEEKYLGFLAPHAKEITKEDVKPGDIMVFKYGRCYAHGAIITHVKPEIIIVHAYSIARRVIEEPLSGNRALTDPIRKPRYFSHWKAS